MLKNKDVYQKKGAVDVSVILQPQLSENAQLGVRCPLSVVRC